MNILESELMAEKAKTLYHIRLRELLLQYSTEANLIAMYVKPILQLFNFVSYIQVLLLIYRTLPVPQKDNVSGPLYMAWLEALTTNMPPFLLVRGNQESVLTFFS